MTTAITHTPSLLRLPQVLNRVGLSRATIWKRVAAGTFPRPIKLGNGARAVAWVEKEVFEWIEAQIAASRSNEVVKGEK